MIGDRSKWVNGVYREEHLNRTIYELLYIGCLKWDEKRFDEWN